MKPLVALIQPRATQGAARTDVRVSTGGSGAAAGLGGNRWEAAITRRPRLTLDLFSPALDGRTQLGRGDLVINLNRIRAVGNIKTFFWLGAPVIIYDASNLDLNTAPIEFTGYVRSTSYDVDTELLTLNFEVSATALDRPLLYSEFTGGGGINGDAQLRGTLLPAGFGSVQNVPPVWFDNTNNIGMIDGYGNCTAITALFEGGNDFGARVADYADYATLLARILDHTVAPGRWATCVAQGLVGLGAPPVKPITVDATFGSNRTGAIIKRILNVHAGVVLGSIDTTALDAVDAALPYPVHYWTGDARAVSSICEALAASCNANMLVTFQGKYSVTRAFGGALALTINKQAPTRATRATKWRALDPDIPVWRMRARTGRPGETLTIDQINYADTLIDRGVYAGTTVYRQGNLVWSPSGAQYLYINATPAAGQALPVSPATATAYWSQTVPASTAADLVYADGTPIESLKPAQIGANVTGTNTAAAIAGQGALATANTADFSTQVSGTTKPADSAGTTLTLAKVGTGTLAIVGNGVTRTDAGAAWNTNAVSSEAYKGSAYVTGLLPTSGGVMLGLTDNASGTSYADLNYCWTNGGGTAQIYEAGNLQATLTSPTNGVSFTATTRFSVVYSGLFVKYYADGVLMRTVQTTGDRIFRAAGAFNYQFSRIAEVTFGPGFLTPDLNSNIIDSASSYATVPRNEIRTPLGTAAAITSQGAFATLSSAAYGSSLLTGFGTLAARATVRIGTELFRADGTTATSDAALVTSLGTASAITSQSAWATYSGLVPANVAGQVTNLDTSGFLSSLDKVTNRRLTLLLRADGTTALTEAMAITSLGTASAIAGQGALATKNTASLDSDVTDGSTYKRVNASETTSGVLKLGVAGSGYRIADARNLPAVVAANIGNSFDGAVTYTAASGALGTGTATGTISVAAGHFHIGTTNLSLSAMSANITGDNGAVTTFYLYISNPSFAGGSFTLHATIAPYDIVDADDRMWIGTVVIGFPGYGGGSASGGGDSGGGGGGHFNDTPY